MKTTASRHSRRAPDDRGGRPGRADDRDKAPAPVFVDAFALCEWLQGRLGDDGRVLARTILRNALLILEGVALALRRSDPAMLVDDADDRLTRTVWTTS